jgi:cell wall-associated NlpC family hydrolase
VKIITGLVLFAVAAVAVPIVAVGVAFGGQLGQLVSQEPPSAYASTVLPSVAISAFEESAEQCVGIPWQVLAAVNLTVDPNVMEHLDTTTGALSPSNEAPPPSGTLGPMGFTPAIWSEYAELYDGAPDSATADPDNEYDAIFTLGRALCALQSSAGDIADALESYDASTPWDQSVLALATRFGMNVDGTTTDIAPVAGDPPPSTSAYPVTFPAGLVFDGSGLALVAAAEQELGVPYVWGGVTAHVGLDCSGLVVVAMASIGVNLLWAYRTSQEQATLGTTEPENALRPGDLLFFEGEDTTGPSELGHVAIYIGDGQMIQAPETGEVVQLTAVPWGAVEIARRVLTDP